MLCQQDLSVDDLHDLRFWWTYNKSNVSKLSTGEASCNTCAAIALASM